MPISIWRPNLQWLWKFCLSFYSNRKLYKTKKCHKFWPRVNCLSHVQQVWRRTGGMKADIQFILFVPVKLRLKIYETQISKDGVVLLHNLRPGTDVCAHFPKHPRSLLITPCEPEILLFLHFFRKLKSAYSCRANPILVFAILILNLISLSSIPCCTIQLH